jgi:ATP-dependent DNA ligase
MLARLADALPTEPGFLFEPKWDGFRALVFRTAEQTLLQSRDGKPLNRYFPELERALSDALPKGCVLDGEIVVASPRGLDFDALQQRIHPAASRIAKLESAAYQPGKRAMLKIKHVRTADCVVAGFRWYKDRSDAVGSLLLGLYDDAGVLQHVGITSSFTMVMRQELLHELGPLREGALESHPWRDRGGALVGDAQRMPGAQSRWSSGKDLSWEPLRPERVCEVRYDHLQGNRFRHATTFVRWRADKPPRECRYDQLEVTTPYELAKVFRD